MPERVREPEPGDRVLLVFNDGQSVEGEFVRSEPRFAIVRVSNVESPFDRRTLAQLIVLETPKSRFRALRAAVKDSDVERRIDLAIWARDQQLFDEGLAEAEGVLEIDPANVDAEKLRTELAMLVRLRAGRGDPQGRPRDEQDPPREAPRRPRLDEFPLLTEAQVNLIKVFEVDLKDPPRMTIARETVDKLLTRYADHPLIPSTREAKEAFRLLPPERILETMFRVRARDLYGEVQVVENPESMKKFRDQVHSAWLINNCATTQCHGGSAAGRLLLTNRRPNADRSMYTNFLILDRFRTQDERSLIDWSEPERSVLLQMGLPRDDAIAPHPEVRGWTPAFRTRDDRRFQNAVDWLKMMYRPRPEYPVEYPPKQQGGAAAGPER
ncbi:MAG: hypothetical protein ACKVZJ_10055 [Phycisphaerales bacterium]